MEIIFELSCVDYNCKVVKCKVLLIKSAASLWSQTLNTICRQSSLANATLAQFFAF